MLVGGFTLDACFRVGTIVVDRILANSATTVVAVRVECSKSRGQFLQLSSATLNQRAGSFLPTGNRRNREESFHAGRIMLNDLIPIAALGVAMLLGMIAAEKFVAMTQRRWRFSIRGLMLFTVLVSVALTIIVTVMKK
jgi:hypothetical protein